MDEFLGVIKAFAFSWAPRGWVACNGQLLQVSQNQALFSLLGNQFGGNGTTTFAVPDLRGRTLIGYGQGLVPTLANIPFATKGGSETAIPAHTHALSPLAKVVSTIGTRSGGEVSNESELNTSVLSSAGNTANIYTANGTINGNILGGVSSSVSGTTDSTGNTDAIANRDPFVAINYCICTEGLYPTRD
jgi:microcystin-dependent protein